MIKIIFGVLLTVAAASVPRASAIEPASDRIVVMISVDGLAHFYFDDPKAAMPNIRAIAAEGARAKTMKASMPTVTWPNHTTLVTGVSPARHGVVGNHFLDRETGKVVALICDPVYDKDEIVKVPTVYDLAKAQGLKTAAIVWPATRGAKSLDWTVPDALDDEVFQKYGTPSLLAECKAAGIPYERYGEWAKRGNGNARDDLYIQMFDLVLKQHRPNLALLHLLDVDHVEHGHGPQSPEAYEAVAAADARVGHVWEKLKSDFAGKATLFIVSDHGFVPVRQLILPNVALRKAGLLDVKGLKIVDAKVRATSEGGGCFVYILDAAHHDELLAKATEFLGGLEGVAEAIPASGFKRLGMADPRQDPHAPDLVLSAKSGYMFTENGAGDLAVTSVAAKQIGAHGADPELPEMRATFVAWGVGIRPGAQLGDIDNRDVAPTVAHALGLNMTDVEGKVLDAALNDSAP